MSRFYKFQLGKFSCIALEDNTKQIPIQKQFPSVNEQALGAAMEASGADMLVPVGFNCLYIDTGTKKILVDTGRGTDKLLDSLQNAGISPDSIDIVILTHGDSDHVGGIENFPSVQFAMPKMAYDIWTHDASRDIMLADYKRVFESMILPEDLTKGLDFREHYGSELLPSLKNRLTLVDLEQDIVPGVRMIDARGHRLDHFAVEIESEGQTILHVVDAFRHPIQITNPDWYSVFDSDPASMGVTTRHLLARMQEKKALLFLAHLPFPGLMKLE